jgi:hypothetical protein
LRSALSSRRWTISSNRSTRVSVISCIRKKLNAANKVRRSEAG